MRFTCTRQNGIILIALHRATIPLNVLETISKRALYILKLKHCYNKTRVIYMLLKFSEIRVIKVITDKMKHRLWKSMINLS